MEHPFWSDITVLGRQELAVVPGVTRFNTVIYHGLELMLLYQSLRRVLRPERTINTSQSSHLSDQILLCNSCIRLKATAELQHATQSPTQKMQRELC